METDEMEYEQNGEREEQQTISLFNFETLQKKFRLVGEQPAAARSGPEWRHRKKVVSRLFQNL